MENKGILSFDFIKEQVTKVMNDYPEVKCAYLYGSYSRGEADEESDVDILVVCPAMGLRYFGIAGKLEEALGKRVDLQSYRQICDETFLGFFLTDAIKIYKKNN